MAKEAFFLSREALYIKVWETPTVKIAKEFRVSDVAIGKMCRRLEVPKPPTGYWRRVETGAKKKIPDLEKPARKLNPVFGSNQNLKNKRPNLKMNTKNLA